MDEDPVDDELRNQFLGGFGLQPFRFDQDDHHEEDDDGFVTQQEILDSFQVNRQNDEEEHNKIAGMELEQANSPYSDQTPYEISPSPEHSAQSLQHYLADNYEETYRQEEPLPPRLPQYFTMKEESDPVVKLTTEWGLDHEEPPFGLSLSNIDDSSFYIWPKKERKLFVALAGHPMSYEDFGNLSTFFHATIEKQQEYAYTIRQVNRIIHDYYDANEAYIANVIEVVQALFKPGVLFFLTKDKGVMRAAQFLGDSTFQQVLLDNPLHHRSQLANNVFYVGGVGIPHEAYIFATDYRYESAFPFLQSMYELLSELWINDGIPFCTSLNFLLDLEGGHVDFDITNGLFTVKTTTPEYQGRIPPYSHIQKLLSAKGIANLPLNPITEFDPRNIEFALIIGGFFSPRATEKVGGKTRDLLSGQQSSTNRISYQFDLHRSWPLGTDAYKTWTKWDLAMSFSDFWRLRPFQFWSEQILKAFRCCLIRVRERLKKYAKINAKKFHESWHNIARLIFCNGVLVLYYHHKREIERGWNIWTDDHRLGDFLAHERQLIHNIVGGASHDEFADLICIYDVIAKISRDERVPFFVSVNYLFIAPTISGTPTEDDFLRRVIDVDGYDFPDFERRRQHNEFESYDYFGEDIFPRNRFHNYPVVTSPVWPGRLMREYDSGGGEDFDDPNLDSRISRRDEFKLQRQRKIKRIEELNPFRQLDYKYHESADFSSDVEKRKRGSPTTPRRHKPSPSGIRYGLHDQPSSPNSSSGFHHQFNLSNSRYGLHDQPSSSSSTHESTLKARRPPPPPPPSFEDQDEFFEEGQIRRKKKKIILPRQQTSQVEEQRHRDRDAARKKYFRDDDDDDDNNNEE